MSDVQIKPGLCVMWAQGAVTWESFHFPPSCSFQGSAQPSRTKLRDTTLILPFLMRLFKWEVPNSGQTSSSVRLSTRQADKRIYLNNWRSFVCSHLSGSYQQGRVRMTQGQAGNCTSQPCKDLSVSTPCPDKLQLWQPQPALLSFRELLFMPQWCSALGIQQHPTSAPLTPAGLRIGAKVTILVLLN